MAEKKYPDDERAALRALLRRVYERSEAGSWAAFARQAGVSEYSLANWRAGREMPGAPNLLRLLATVGVIGPAPDYALPDEQQQEEPGRQESLAAEVSRLADVVREGFARMEELLPAASSPGTTRPARKQAAR